MTPAWIPFFSQEDERGVLVPVEGGRDVPFEIRRVYTLRGFAPGAVRGGHAHRRLRQVVVCVAGSCVIELDDGGGARRFALNDPARGLLLEPRVWHELREFSADCVVMVLASEHFDETDYVREHAEFLREVKEARG